MNAPTHLSLFTGVGGLDLAAEWAGFETVGQCEYADYPTKVLEKCWPDVPRWRDIRTLTKEGFYARTGRRTVDIISGGFPCQPFSVAGKQKGKKDDRYLWPEMLRVIRELTPAWVIGENVPGILRIAAADVVKDLERLGYNVVVFAFEAAAVGAKHRRERIFFVANAKHDGRVTPEIARSVVARSVNSATGQEPAGELAGCGERIARRNVVADPARELRKRSGKAWRWRREPANRDWWSAEPNVGRVAHGIPARVDRLRALGNAVAPQQAYPLFRSIYAIITGGAAEALERRDT